MVLVDIARLSRRFGSRDNCDIAQNRIDASFSAFLTLLSLSRRCGLRGHRNPISGLCSRWNTGFAGGERTNETEGIFLVSSIKNHFFFSLSLSLSQLHHQTKNTRTPSSRPLLPTSRPPTHSRSSPRHTRSLSTPATCSDRPS